MLIRTLKLTHERQNFRELCLCEHIRSKVTKSAVLTLSAKTKVWQQNTAAMVETRKKELKETYANTSHVLWRRYVSTEEREPFVLCISIPVKVRLAPVSALALALPH